MMKTLIVPLFLAVLAMPLRGEGTDDIEGDIIDNINPPTINELIDYNRSNNKKDGFSAHRLNFILPFTYSGLPARDERQDWEVKFQMSIKQRLLKFYGWAFYFGYTQKSFWQAYDTGDSRPFRENNFNPELFFRTRMWSGFRIDSGMEHESNGRDIPYSRSWNRLCLTPYFENGRVIASLKAWYRLREKKKTDEMDADGDDNSDICRYYGYGELGLTIKFPELFQAYCASLVRYNPRYGRGAVELTLTVPLSLNSMSFMIQYWEGYGESLIDYNVHQRKIGIGLNFTR
jgi:phospholipase A1/A2